MVGRRLAVVRWWRTAQLRLQATGEHARAPRRHLPYLITARFCFILPTQREVDSLREVKGHPALVEYFLLTQLGTLKVRKNVILASESKKISEPDCAEFFRWSICQVWLDLMTTESLPQTTTRTRDRE